MMDVIDDEQGKAIVERYREKDAVVLAALDVRERLARRAVAVSFSVTTLLQGCVLIVRKGLARELSVFFMIISIFRTAY